MLPPSKFTKGNRKIFIYDFINQKLVFEHRFLLKTYASSSSNSQDSTYLPGDKSLKIRSISE